MGVGAGRGAERAGEVGDRAGAGPGTDGARGAAGGCLRTGAAGGGGEGGGAGGGAGAALRTGVVLLSRSASAAIAAACLNKERAWVLTGRRDKVLTTSSISLIRASPNLLRSSLTPAPKGPLRGQGPLEELERSLGPVVGAHRARLPRRRSGAKSLLSPNGRRARPPVKISAWG